MSASNIVVEPIDNEQKKVTTEQNIPPIPPATTATNPRAIIARSGSWTSVRQRQYSGEDTRAYFTNPETAGSFDFLIQLVILGDSSVGKTTLLQRYAYDQTDHRQQITTPPLGNDLYSSLVQVGNNRVKVLLTDTAGQERFRSLSAQHVRGKHGVIMVYDVSSRESFDHINEWYALIQQYYTEGNEPLVVLIGNKIDKQRAISREQVEEYAQEKHYWYYEMSALQPHDSNREIREPINHFVAACLAMRTAAASRILPSARPSQQLSSSELIKITAHASQVIDTSEEEKRRRNLVQLHSQRYGATDARKKLAVADHNNNSSSSTQEMDDVPSSSMCSCYS